LSLPSPLATEQPDFCGLPLYVSVADAAWRVVFPFFDIILEIDLLPALPGELIVGKAAHACTRTQL
jgi:hypothetical protein